MGKLETYQNYANRCANKIEVQYPVLRWSDGKCSCKRDLAHCHVRDSKFPKGTICLNKSYFAKASIKEWHHTIAHEVAHLAVKSTHRTPTFDRQMVKLGVATRAERLNARSAKKGHHHIWINYIRVNHLDEEQERWLQCQVCGKKKQ
uniref:SprT-like domain-containing protein n=1 Tax=viral metagenome TaxID=1070528 RepID=A0A6H1ZJ52_9ZZZZ